MRGKGVVIRVQRVYNYPPLLRSLPCHLAAPQALSTPRPRPVPLLPHMPAPECSASGYAQLAPLLPRVIDAGMNSTCLQAFLILLLCESCCFLLHTASFSLFTCLVSAPHIKMYTQQRQDVCFTVVPQGQNSGGTQQAHNKYLQIA